jgi:hypothetical protein
MSILQKDAEFCGMELNKYLASVGLHRGAFSAEVLEAWDRYIDHLAWDRLQAEEI